MAVLAYLQANRYSLSICAPRHVDKKIWCGDAHVHMYSYLAKLGHGETNAIVCFLEKKYRAVLHAKRSSSPIYFSRLWIDMINYCIRK